jgi:hypothetical protein
MWRMHQHADLEKLPKTRTVVHLTLTGVGGAEGWLSIDAEGMTVCKDDQVSTSTWPWRQTPLSCIGGSWASCRSAN